MNPQNNQPNENNSANVQPGGQVQPGAQKQSAAASSDQQSAPEATTPTPPQTATPSQPPVQQAPQPQSSNKLAITALVLGILSFLSSFIMIGGLLGLIGLIFGIIAKKKKQSPGMAITGMVLSVLSILMALALVVLLAIPAYLGYQHGSSDLERKEDLGVIADSLEDYYTSNGYYPYAEDASALEGVIAETVPKDPRGTSYIYQTSDCQNNECQGYRLIAELKVHDSPDADRTVQEYENAYVLKSEQGEFRQ